MTDDGHNRRFPFGGGAVVLAADGAVRAIRHPRRDHSMLLEDAGTSVEAVMHDAAHDWGKGFAILDGGGYRFDTPTQLDWATDGVDLRYELGPLRLSVRRRIGTTWTESYELHNTSARAVTVGCFAVSTPWRDLYGSSHDSLHRAVHAHVWAGGADAWVWAIPMDGSGPGLGLSLTEGELWAYSVESRDQVSSSNVRGHLYLHVTDHARAPHAMGGQPVIELPARGRYRLGWRLQWYPSLAELHAEREPLISIARVAAEVGDSLPVRLAPGATTQAALPLSRNSPGIFHVHAERDGHRSRISVLFHLPLRTIAETRAEFLLMRQRPVERADSRRHAFVPYDNDSGLRVLAGGWSDWSDARERVGSALVLQQLRRLGWGDRTALNEALIGYRRFVLDHVVQPDGTVLDGTPGHRVPRLYNFPWFARFLLDEGDLDLALAVMTRFYALDGKKFLAFELGSVVRDLAAALRNAGRDPEADALTDLLLDQAATYLRYGDELPPHEVNYEQSIAAPLLDLLLAAHALRPAAVPAPELRRRLGWLRAFAADQPDVRMREIPIRHWDGYWFGRSRMWGDVFPHYWSILSAGAYLAWPDGLLPDDETASLRESAYTILRGNLVTFRPDGSATCAFVYPSCVNGQPAHVADPLANDQDWALVYALRHSPLYG